MSSSFQQRTGLLSILVGATLLFGTPANSQQSLGPKTAQEWVSAAHNCADSLCRFSALQQALRAEPENRDTLLALAYYYRGHEQREKSRDILRKITARNARDFEARKKLADLSIEAGDLDDDEEGMLTAGTRLCAAAETSADDELCEIAAGRIDDAAANSKTFRKSLGAIRKPIASDSPQADRFRLAQVSAAEDGAPEFETLFQSRDSGLLTDWKIVGPLGRFPNTDFNRNFGPEQDGLKKKSYGSRPVRIVQFANGRVELPRETERNGVFYAASDVDLNSGGEWRVWVESPGTLEVFIDGKRALLKDDRAAMHPQVLWEMRRMDEGMHRVVVKFIASALPFRVAIMPPSGGVKKRNNKPGLHAGPDAEYVSVALHYWRRGLSQNGRRENAK